MENGNNQEVGMEINYEMDTDLALEAGECLTKKGETVDGISLKEEEAEGGKVRITKVEIQNEDGAKRMGKPMGRYITLESLLLRGEEGKEACASVLADYIEQLLPGKWKRILAVGLGNRELTVDSLGPKVVDNLFMTYHHTGDGLCGRNQAGCSDRSRRAGCQKHPPSGYHNPTDRHRDCARIRSGKPSQQSDQGKSRHPGGGHRRSHDC